MSTHYVSGRWRVKSGLEDRFVDAWEELAVWSETTLRSGTARLLQSADDSSVFLGLWEFSSLEAIDAWREQQGVRERLASLGGLVAQADSGDYELRVVVGG